MHHRTSGATSRISRYLCLLALSLVALAGCDSILEVDRPGQLPAEDVDNPDFAQTLVRSAVQDFECVYNNYVFAASTHSDEMSQASGNLTFRRWGLRRIDPNFSNYVSGNCGDWGYPLWLPLQTARVQADSNFARIQSFPDDSVEAKTSKLATLRAYGGYTYTLFGETFCRATFDGGPVKQPDEILQIAEQHFTEAIDLASQAGNTDILNMARVGRARVRLKLGQDQAAAEDARKVPEGYEKMARMSGQTQRFWNNAQRWYIDWGHAVVSPSFRDLEWKGVDDPRVEERDAGRVAFDGETPLVIPTKYTSLGQDIPIATWDEAQLIIAEAEGGDTAVEIINAFHDRAGLPAYSRSDEPIQEHIIEERRRELFLEGGHRLHDVLRFEQLEFPSGVDPISGQPFGNATCLPLPDREARGNSNV